MKLPPTIKQTFYVFSNDETKYSGSSETEAQTVYDQCIANGETNVTIEVVTEDAH